MKLTRVESLDRHYIPIPIWRKIHMRFPFDKGFEEQIELATCQMVFDGQICGRNAVSSSFFHGSRSISEQNAASGEEDNPS